MKRKILQIFALLLCLSAVLFLLDVHILRGFYTIPYFHKDLYVDFDGSIEYNVIPNDNGTFDLYLKNNDFAYYPIVLYRYDRFFDLDDSVLFNYASRYKLLDQNEIIGDSGGGFDCGTGLRRTYIRPFESFLIKNCGLEKLIDLDQIAYLFFSMKNYDFNKMDTFDLKFYLPINSFGEEDTRIYSNKISIPKKLIEPRYELINEYINTAN